MDCHKNAEAGEPDSGSSKKKKKKVVIAPVHKECRNAKGLWNWLLTWNYSFGNTFSRADD